MTATETEAGSTVQYDDYPETEQGFSEYLRDLADGLFPFPGYREYQDEILYEVLESFLIDGYKNVVVEGPTGIGKSPKKGLVVAHRGIDRHITPKGFERAAPVHVLEPLVLSGARITVDKVTGELKECRVLLHAKCPDPTHDVEIGPVHVPLTSSLSCPGIARISEGERAPAPSFRSGSEMSGSLSSISETDLVTVSSGRFQFF